MRQHRDLFIIDEFEVRIWTQVAGGALKSKVRTGKKGKKTEKASSSQENNYNCVHPSSETSTIIKSYGLLHLKNF